MLTKIKSWLPTIAVMIGALFAGAVIHGQYGWAAYWVFVAGIATGALLVAVGVDRCMRSEGYIDSLAEMIEGVKK